MAVEELTNLREWEAEKAKTLFGDIAEEIRRGTLQLHFGDNTFLFAKTDEILYFALEGDKLAFGAEDYDQRRTAARQGILKNVEAISKALADYPRNDCPAVRKSLETIKTLAEEIKVWP